MVSNSDRDDVIEKLAIFGLKHNNTRHLRINMYPFYQIAASVLTENYFMEESEIGSYVVADEL